MDNIAQQITNKLTNIILNGLIPQIKQVIKNSIDQNFKQQGRWGSGRYGGGSNKWAQSKRAQKQSGMTLQDTGRLAASTRVDVQQDGMKLKIAIGSNLKYAAIHQFGGIITIPGHTRSAKWKATKNKATGNYGYKFAKKGARGKNVISRNFSVASRTMHIQKRPYLVLQDEDIINIAQRYMDYLTKKLK